MKKLRSETNNIEEFLKFLVAMEMYRGKISKAAIAKRLHVSKTTVVAMLKDFKTQDFSDYKRKGELS